MTIDYSVAEGYIVTDVSANYGTNYSDNGDVVSLTNIVRPATVTVNARRKQQKVTFNSNGGSGTMTLQSYSYGEAQALTANNFTRNGYTFTGWNTKADDTIKREDEAAVKSADDAYNTLTIYEKSLVNEDTKKALDDAKVALAELNKPAEPNSPATGDNRNLWLWVSLLFVSGTALLEIILNECKRKVTDK